MIKVLYISMGTSFGGIEQLSIQILKNINKDIRIDLLSPNSIPYKNYEKEINKYNSKVYSFNLKRKSLREKILYMNRLNKFLKDNKYDIVHINSTVFLFSFSTSYICKKNKVKVITHAHNNFPISKIKKIFINILKPFHEKLVDIKLSCSKQAANLLYRNNDNVIIIHDGINIDDYKFNSKDRELYRKKLNISNKTVYGHTGRFETQKNHELLIDIFYKIQEKEKNSVLLLIGTGSLEDRIKEKVNKLNISDKVLFLGYRQDVNRLLNCMDKFIFPSIYEGLGISIIESQTNGLPTIVSKEVPEEANISKNFIKIDSFDIDRWVNKILSIKNNKRDNSYKDTIKNEYDIKDVSKKLEKIYKDLLK